MDLHSAKRNLYSTTFLTGSWKRAKALAYLTQAPEPEAMDILVESLLDGCLAAKKIEKFFKTVKDQAKLDRLWLNWAQEGEDTLAEILMSRQDPASKESGQELRALSLLLLGKVEEIEAGRDVIKDLIRWEQALQNEKIIEVLTNYFKACDGKPADLILILSLWLGLFDAIGNDREAAEHVRPLSADKDPDVSSAANKFLKQLPRPVKIYLILSRNQLSRLQVTKNQAMELQPFFSDSDERVRTGAENYLALVKEQNPDWLIHFLLKINREDEILQDRNSTITVLSFLGDQDTDINTAAFRYVKKLPLEDPLNDAIFKAWVKTGSKPLLSLIHEQERLPTSPAVETLYYFISGQVDRYHALEDPDGELFLEAWLMAGDTFRKIINDQVLKSGDAKLVNAYRKALSHREDFDSELVRKSLMAADNEDGLFEEAKQMTLLELLDLCRRWAENKWKPDDSRHAAVVKTAVEKFRQIGEIQVTEGPPPPAGTEDLFAYWDRQQFSEKELRQGLSLPDPFIRMRSLYLGHQKGLMNKDRLEQAARSDDWPERLIARMIQPAIKPDEEKDHVEWINVCSGMDAEILQAKVGCTPEEYHRYGEMLGTLSNGGAAMARSKTFLEILLTFQWYFVGPEVGFGKDDGSTKRDDIEMEDLSVDAAKMAFSD